MTRSEFLLETIANCKRCLAAPDVRYPNGRMSHDVNREVLDRTMQEYDDYVIDNGRWHANGSFAGFEERA